MCLFVLFPQNIPLILLIYSNCSFIPLFGAHRLCFDRVVEAALY